MGDKEVVFVLQGEEVSIEQRILESASEYFAQLLNTPEEYPQVRILLPDWVNKRSLLLYLDYLRLRRLPRLDLLTAQKLLWLADFLQDPGLQTSLILDTILPHMTKESVLLFLQDSHTKLSLGSANPVWKELLIKCLDAAAKDAVIIFDKFKPTVLAMPTEVVEQLVHRAVVYGTKHSATDYTHILDVLKTVSKAGGFIDLLAMEEKKALNSLKWAAPRDPLFAWELTNITLDNYFKESDSFEVAGTAWTISVWSFAHENKLDIAIRNTPGNEAPKGFPRNAVVALSCVCDVTGLEAKRPVIITSIMGTKTQNVVRSIENVSSLDLSKLTISIQVEVEHVYASILTHMVRHPGQSLCSESLAALDRDKLLVMLKHKYLAVQSEDEVVGIVGKWCQEKFGDSPNPDVEICDVLESVRWPFVSLKGLLESLRNFPALKNSKCFKEIFRREIEQRGSLKRDGDSLPPRHSYKNDSARETFSSQKDFIEALSTLVLDLEYNPESEAVTG